MTTITIDRAVLEQALKALEKYRKMMFVEAGCRFGEGDAAITALRAALAQEQEPEPVPHQHEWFRAGGWEPGRIRCIHCGRWGKETFDE